VLSEQIDASDEYADSSRVTGRPQSEFEMVATDQTDYAAIRAKMSA